MSDGINGTSSSANGLTPAQQLLAKHQANEGHHVEVEDVVDEEDIAHPPPSAIAKPQTTQPTLSDVAKGKQKAQEPAPARPGRVFDTKDEDAFPALGPSKAGSAPAVGAGWGKRPVIAAVNGNKAPVNGAAAAGPSPINIPGRQRETITLQASEMTPRAQLKKPIPSILDDINRRFKVKVTRTDGAQGASIFIAVGPIDLARGALKEVASQIGSKQTTTVLVPTSVRPYIIGKQGATIQKISKSTGARIQMPKQDAAAPVRSGQDDDDGEIEVVIEGDAVSAALARREIEALVAARTKDVALKVRDIPAEFYPFLRGVGDEGLNALEESGDIKVQIPRYHTWKDNAPPAPVTTGQLPSFVPQPSAPISISGDRQAAQLAREQIQRQVEELRRQLIHDEMQLERGRHQFIIGDRGEAIQDILNETGCAVIFPPAHDNSETVYIIGPPDRINDGVNKVMDLAASMSVTNVDIAKQHANSQAHARNLTRYLQQRQAIADLERRHNAKISIPPPDAFAPWEIYSSEGRNGMRARQDIMELVRAHPPQRVQPLPVNPFFHQHIQERHAPQLRQEHGVFLVLPEGEDSDELLLVFEQPGSPSGYELPRTAPNAQEIRQHQQAIQAAQKYLEEIIGQHASVAQRDVEAPPKFHEKIRRYTDRQQQNLPENQIPVQLLFGPQASRSAPAPGAGGNISLRGPTNQVDALHELLLEFLKEAEQDELERSYVTSFDFPQKFANFLIGKRGENIKKLRDEYDVEIQVKDGKVDVQGPKKKADACKSHILKELSKWQDETSHTLFVEPEFHKDLIGAQGSQVKKLEERYNVRINFPRSGDVDDGASVASTKNHRPQAANHVVVKGPSKGADEARKELMDLHEFYKKNSHTAIVSIAQSQIASIIGRQGSGLEDLRLRTNCQINVPGKGEADANGRVAVHIKGEKANVAEAKKILEATSKQYDNTVVRTINVDKKYHQSIIGPKGSTLGKIQREAGGDETARIIQMPPRDSEDTTIKVVGSSSVVENIVAALEKFVSEREGRITETLEVPPAKHRLLIGHGGATRRKLESELNVTIDIPKQDVSGAARSAIKLSGQPADIARAKEHITGLLKEQEGETILVPRAYHYIISENGSLFHKLKDDHRVSVDHGGQQPPPRPSGRGNARGRVNGGAAMPLITDDPSAAADAHSWEVEHKGGDLSAEDEAATIPWILRGQNPEAVAKVRAQIEAALSAARKSSATGYLILPEPKSYRFVIGQGGATINNIRKVTGTRIQVPKAGQSGEAITIEGDVEGVEEAKEMVLEAVKQGLAGGGQRRGGGGSLRS